MSNVGKDGRKTKFIFVTGGVVSSLGKGLAAASIGGLLESRGLTVTLLKMDPFVLFHTRPFDLPLKVITGLCSFGLFLPPTSCNSTPAMTALTVCPLRS